MPSADFAAAQARLLERRRHRDEAERARYADLEASRAATTSRLPFPFRTIGDASLSVWDSIRGREGTRPAFRVGQVDAELLDEELLELLKGQVGEAVKYYGVCAIHLVLNYLLHSNIFSIFGGEKTDSLIRAFVIVSPPYGLRP
jgi:peroxin-2